ncbi:rhamnogalacturonan I rhamnosyltransferase 1-like [Zingiber officinale]|uniref:rhamnogalacturonan I rhamnosyltransferase 1-like n=1 Tax=Zingiber officinale TaxID=94328 RepID=UPI001C4C52F3|nr:rhamnogalacturonan I rhamnosyltransferase 1-like [Zingiber officinale]
MSEGTIAVEVSGLPQARAAMTARVRRQAWFVTACGCVLLWTCLIQLLAYGRLWQSWNPARFFLVLRDDVAGVGSSSAPPPLTPPSPGLQSRNYTSNGYLKLSCNGGLNQMRAAICDMVMVARLLNLTLVVPELDKNSFWADPSNFDDIFDVRYFIKSLKDEVRIIKKLPNSINRNVSSQFFMMRPVSWSDEKYYIQQILPLFNKFNVIHFNKTDARLANNLAFELQKLRCRVNYHALKFSPQIMTLGNKLVQILRGKGSFVTLHLRYEMDMLAFSGCTRDCSEKEAEELKRLRYAYPWWREKEINSTAKRLQGLCPLTPEETTLILKALGFDKDTVIYIASGEIYGGEKRLSVLRAEFPNLVKKEMLLNSKDLQQFQNHSSKMAALDYMVSLASDTFIPTYDGNMAKVVEGHRRYLGFQKTILLDRRKLVKLLDMHNNKTLPWDEFASSVKQVVNGSLGQPICRKVLINKPKEEDYFYANPHECLTNAKECLNVPYQSNSSR